VRIPLEVRDRPRRAPDEALTVRFPGLLRLGARLLFRLPPRSRLRQALLRRVVCQGQEAFNRGDFAAVVPKYQPDIEVFPPEELVGLGELRSVYRGHAELGEFHRSWAETWAASEVAPRELIDLGDRLLLLGRMENRGSASGVSTVAEYAQLWDMREGLAVRERVFVRWADARAAAGLTQA
jgi:ketosteroid isomerase-like protein